MASTQDGLLASRTPGLSLDARPPSRLLGPKAGPLLGSYLVCHPRCNAPSPTPISGALRVKRFLILLGNMPKCCVPKARLGIFVIAVDMEKGWVAWRQKWVNEDRNEGLA